MITLDAAADLTRTGDVWIFRGSSGADRAIRGLTNAPVNHVGMAVVLDDLPPLMWHAELGRALVDVWTGTHQRGVQLHDLRAAVLQWGRRYHQRCWLRQLAGPVDAAMEDAVLRTVARLDGTPFPSTARLAGRWARGRLPSLSALRSRLPLPGPPGTPGPAGGDPVSLESAYCAEVVAVTYEEMGLSPPPPRPQLVRPRPLLERRPPGPDRRLHPGRRDRGDPPAAPRPDRP
ncbi:MAG: hypothetical protein ACT4RN_10280 [Pseudonocardia sp.]